MVASHIHKHVVTSTTGRGDKTSIFGIVDWLETGFEIILKAVADNAKSIGKAPENLVE